MIGDTGYLFFVFGSGFCRSSVKIGDCVGIFRYLEWVNGPSQFGGIDGFVRSGYISAKYR